MGLGLSTSTASVDLEDEEYQCQPQPDDQYLQHLQQQDPMHGHSIVNVPDNIMEMIFHNLSLHDISRLSQTCRIQNEKVGEFLRHECLVKNIETDKIKAFLDENKHLLTVMEQEIFNNMKFQRSLLWRYDNVSFVDRRLLYKALYLLENNQLHLNSQRVSLADPAVFFPHRGNDNYAPIGEGHEGNYISLRYCDILGRNIVTVKSVCWLEFAYNFEDVEPGKYSISFKIKIEEDFQWPHDDADPTELTITHPEGEVRREVFRDWWEQLHDEDDGEMMDVVDGVTVTLEESYEDEIAWISVTLPQFVMSTTGDVRFHYRDVICDWWKEGLSFDYIQLSKH